MSALDGPLVGLLGPVTVRSPGCGQVTPAPLDGLVLAHLTLAGGRSVGVDALIEAVWGGRAPDQARNALQVKVSRLRGLLGERAPALVHDAGGYRLTLEMGETDVDRFLAGIGEGDRLLAERPAEAAAHFAAALMHWRGEPLAGLGEHPRLVAARIRFTELRASGVEGHAEALLGSPSGRGRSIAELRGILETDPLRPRARALLMRGLDAAGRRAEALAVYDAGRRMFAQTAGLEPPEELRLVFEDLLERERRATRRAADLTRRTSAVPAGLADTVRWVAGDGDLDSALRLALRGSWWWWLAGQRGIARDLFEDLLERSGDAPHVDGTAVLSARVWAAVYESLGADATAALGRGRESLELVGRPPWDRHDTLAATLVAERLYERGDHEPAARLLRIAADQQARRGDEWGQAFCAAVGARGRLLAGDPAGAMAQAETQLRRFLALGDLAGQVVCLDVIGYAAEVTGDLVAATRAHTRAVELARRAGAPEWAASQLTRLGNVSLLAERDDGPARLERAVRTSEELGADTVAAMGRNGLGVAHAWAGDREAARHEHHAAAAWYDATGSTAGQAYTRARLAMVEDEPGRALDLAAESLRLAVPTRDPRAVAHSLEAVGLSASEPAAAANALGAALALRRRAGAPLPEPHLRGLRDRVDGLRRELGDEAYDDHRRRGEAAPQQVAARW